MATTGKANAYLRLTGKQWQFTRRIPGTAKRLVVNLHTSDLVEARKLRDQLWADFIRQHPQTPDEVALRFREELQEREDDQDVSEAALDWAEGLEPKVGTEEAIRLFKTAVGQNTLIQAHLEAFIRERPCATTTRLARLTSIKSLPFKTVEQVTTQVAGKYVSDLSASGMAPATVNSRISHLKGYWSFLVSKGLAKSNPWQGQAVKRDRRFRMKSGSAVWTIDEVRTILTDCERSLRLVLQVLIYSGCRVGELANLRVQDVRQDGFEIVEGKTAAAERTVYLPRSIMAAVHKQCAGQPEGAFVFLRGIPCGGARGRPGAFSKLLSAELRRLFPQYDTDQQRNSLKTTHGLRKLWITIAEQEGCPVHLFQAAVGHQRQGVTFEVYSAGPSQAQIREVFAKVAQRLDDEIVFTPGL